MIVNPISGMGSGRKQAPRIEELLRENDYDVDILYTDAKGSAQTAAAEAGPADVSVILSVGGDGTLNEVVNGVADKGIPVTIFPTGTGNVLAKEYGIPRDAKRVCEMIVRGKTEQLDVGLINGRRFLLFAGAGFDAAVTMSIYHSRTGRMSMLNYVAPTLKTLFSYRFPRMQVTVDGESAGEATSVIVSNVRSYGGPFSFLDDADPTDGLFDICLMRGHRRRDLVRYIWGGFRHRIGKLPDTEILRGTSIELAAEDEAPIQADGDFIGKAPARIDLLPARLPLIVP